MIYTNSKYRPRDMQADLRLLSWDVYVSPLHMCPTISLLPPQTLFSVNRTYLGVEEGDTISNE